MFEYNVKQSTSQPSNNSKNLPLRLLSQYKKISQHNQCFQLNTNSFYRRPTRYLCLSWSSVFVFCYFTISRPFLFPSKTLRNLTELLWSLPYLDLTGGISKAEVIGKTFVNISQIFNCLKFIYSIERVGERKDKMSRAALANMMPQVAMST